MYFEVIYCSCLYVYKLEEIFTTAEENEAVVSQFCGLGISLKDEICIETEVNLWEKKGQQIFSKIVRASKLTRQRTIQIHNAHLDSSRCWQYFHEATKKKKLLIHGELTVVILFVDVFF